MGPVEFSVLLDCAIKNPVFPLIRVQDDTRVTEQWQREGGRYIPNPATWLNRGRWDDEYEEVTQPYGSNSQHFVGNGGQQPPTQGTKFKPDALAGFKRAEDAEWYKDEDTDEPKKQDGGALVGFKQSDDSG